ncbi:MAG: ATPase, type [Rhizobacter sp.]|nr:ATPase, type [Rhizobacter sp.]
MITATAVREGRGIFDSIRKFLRYLLSSNMGEVLTVFLGVVGAGLIGLTGQGSEVVLPLLATQSQLFNCFNARSETTSAFSHLFVNPWLWGAVALSALLQVAVVNLPFLRLAFGTVPLQWDQWLSCVAMGSTVLWYSELRKGLGRVWKRWSQAPIRGDEPLKVTAT